MTNQAGRTIVRYYYSTSPPIADLVQDNDGLRLIVREGLVKTSVYVARSIANVKKPRDFTRFTQEIGINMG